MLEPPLRGGGAERVGCDCGGGGDGIGALDVVEPLLDEPDEPELDGGDEVVGGVRGIAWAAAMPGKKNPAATAEASSKRLLMRMSQPPPL